MSTITFNTPALTVATPAMADFVRVCKELHDQLIAAGMVATSDTGQLDFTAMAALTLTAGVVYGYRIYRLDDGNALPVYLKLRFVCGPGANSSNRQPWTLYVSIGLGTNGSGTLSQATLEYVIGAGGSYQNSDTAKHGVGLTSLISCKAGFLGVSWKQSITAGNSTYGPSASDSIGIGNFFVCRDTDDSGSVTADGVSLVVIAPGGTSYLNFGGFPIVAHINTSGTVIASGRTCMAIGGDTLTTIDGKIPVFHLFTLTPTPKRLAQLLVVTKPIGSINNDEFDARSVGTEVRHFIAMNTCWPGDVYSGTVCRAAIAMLWES